MANGKANTRENMEKDLLLINKVKKNQDSESFKELLSRHSGIYVEMVNRYIPSHFAGVNKEDILEDKDFCIYDAIIKYDERKNTKFSTYVGNVARWKCLNIFNKSIKTQSFSIDEESENLLFKSKKESNECSDPFQEFAPLESYNFNIKSIEDEENLDKIFSFVENHKDKRLETIFKMRYQNEKKLTPWKKIAKKLNISIQACINIHNRHLTEIKKHV